ncbi:heme exporter protein CcmD [Shewanella sp. NIFS-20-20]|uniref:heme exporter protein CcmD n=1 Tax=Shewanella sp. NIFS-20-20 TaxID=2853806 RepID=UPI001C4806B9|nr:heme exporter protein CcmD [Shewanella sp. NIFS-20-20]MBV7316409.1 heme exporter protein CcmD [Shewanella sp. NIFS-20-20]
MEFNSFGEFINMGGYAFFVWLAYGVTFGSLLILTLVSISRKKRVLTDIAKKIAREERLKQNRSNKQ